MINLIKCFFELCSLEQVFAKDGIHKLDYSEFKSVVKNCPGLKGVVSMIPTIVLLWKNPEKVLYWEVYVFSYILVLETQGLKSLCIIVQSFVSHCLPTYFFEMSQKESHIHQLFMKIDYTCDGKIEWVWLIHCFLFKS